mmetsp:Transcript_55488/g.99614  ORF Transcript_55488/g.99614 Transcript_55488/m.99614 type:complete len:88 (+) Transcript_55488:470-733(+)
MQPNRDVNCMAGMRIAIAGIAAQCTAQAAGAAAASMEMPVAAAAVAVASWPSPGKAATGSTLVPSAHCTTVAGAALGRHGYHHILPK